MLEKIFVDEEQITTAQDALEDLRKIIEKKYESNAKPIEIEELKNKQVSYYNPFDFV